MLRGSRLWVDRPTFRMIILLLFQIALTIWILISTTNSRK